MDQNALRDRTRTTRILLLAHLNGNPRATLSEAAQVLGITVQAVSAHARSLGKEGLLQAVDGLYRPTPAGLQALHEGVRRLRDAVGELSAGLDTIQATSAVAAGPIQAGQDVGLFMAKGDLEARATRNAPSRGRARNDARPGEEVIVGDLQGVVRLDAGMVRILCVPAPLEGGLAKVDRAAVAKRLQDAPHAKLAALGTSAVLLARELVAQGKRPSLDFEFAAERAAFNAAERGLDVWLVTGRDRVPDVLATFESLNGKTLRRVAVEVLDAALKA